MSELCPTCGTEIRARAKFCAACGARVAHAIQRVEATPMEFREPIVPAVDRQLAMQRLEVMTRMNAAMNDQRIKAMVMAIAARGGTGTIGVWSDD